MGGARFSEAVQKWSDGINYYRNKSVAITFLFTLTFNSSCMWEVPETKFVKKNVCGPHIARFWPIACCSLNSLICHPWLFGSNVQITWTTLSCQVSSHYKNIKLLKCRTSSPTILHRVYITTDTLTCTLTHSLIPTFTGVSLPTHRYSQPMHRDGPFSNLKL